MNQGSLSEHGGRSERALVLVPLAPGQRRPPARLDGSEDPVRRDVEGRVQEAVGLAQAINLDVVDGLAVPLAAYRPATLIGEGKVEDLAGRIAAEHIGLVIIDHALSPVQQRNLERTWKAKVIDRTGLILEIFGERAQTREGRLQVELAHLQYQRSRLVRSWTHLERQRGGFGFLGGPGETQIEADRRLIDERIQRIEKELESVVRTRRLQRRRRKRDEHPVVALVGYTNAGKSTLLNALSGSDIYVADQLFATLDPTTRRIKLPGGREVLVTDTVGFIQKLPTTLVAAFRATLEEIADADIILHVVDITHKNVEQQAATVLRVLGELNAADQPIITALNKIDQLPAAVPGGAVGEGLANAVSISALTGQGLPDLLARIEQMLDEALVSVRLLLPYQRGDLLGLIHQRGVVSRESHDQAGTRVSGKVPASLLARFEPYLTSPPAAVRDRVQ